MNIQQANHLVFTPEGQSFLASTTNMALHTLKIDTTKLSFLMAEIAQECVASVDNAIEASYPFLSKENKEAVKTMLFALVSGYGTAQTFSQVAHIINLTPEQVPGARQLLKELGYEGKVDIMSISTATPVIPAASNF